MPGSGCVASSPMGSENTGRMGRDGGRVQVRELVGHRTSRTKCWTKKTEHWPAIHKMGKRIEVPEMVIPHVPKTRVMS